MDTGYGFIHGLAPCMGWLGSTTVLWVGSKQSPCAFILATVTWKLCPKLLPFKEIFLIVNPSYCLSSHKFKLQRFKINLKICNDFRVEIIIHYIISAIHTFEIKVSKCNSMLYYFNISL